MNAYRCDRCGKFYRPYIPDGATTDENGTVRIETYHRYAYESACRCYRLLDKGRFDLCPACVEALAEFLKEDR